MTTDSPEFTAMLEKIPTHIMLTPCVDRCKDGDEILGARDPVKNVPAWISLMKSFNGTLFKTELPIRRPIPEHIHRNAAFWALYDSLATVHPMGSGVLFVRTLPYCPHGSTQWQLKVTEPQGFCYGMRKFKNEEAANEARQILGGEQNIIDHLSSGCLLPKWMAGEI